MRQSSPLGDTAGITTTLNKVDPVHSLVRPTGFSAFEWLAPLSGLDCATFSIAFISSLP